MTAIAIIPARGGSRRIPHKNIREFHGKPIIAYSIEAAFASGLFGQHVYVSTDDEEIAHVARQYGAGVLTRGADMAADEVGTQEVTADALKLARGVNDLMYASNAIACCIYATSPLISVDDLKRGHELLSNSSMNYAMSVGNDPLCDAGQFYWGWVSAFANGWPLLDALTYMVPVAPNRVCDINVEADWQRAEAMYAELHKGAA